MKKILLILIMALAFCFTINAKAAELNPVDFTESNTVDSSNVISTDYLSGGVEYSVARTIARNNGLENGKTNNFKLSWLDTSNTTGIRVVNWTKSSTIAWTGSKVTSMASDYEAKNPGYIVVGGINGDFFHIQTTCETANLCMQEGNLLKPYVWTAIATGVMGWKSDGTFIFGQPTISTNMYLDTINDDGTDSEDVTIASVNKSVSETGISLITSDLFTKDGDNYKYQSDLDSYDLDLTGYKIVKVMYSIHRYLNDGNSVNHDRLYVKGTVYEITDGDGVCNGTEEITCYLVSKDGSLDNLELGDTVRMQYHLEGEWADVINAAGYHDQILENGKSLFYQANLSDYSGKVTDINYINCSKNRTIVGRKPDGSFVFMVIEFTHKTEGDGNMGASYYEAAEYLRLLGCTDGWLLDGGGSSTMTVSEENSFVMVAGGSDGDERSDGNGLYFVMRDPGIEPTVVGREHDSITIKINEKDSYGIHNCSNFKLEYNDQVIDIKVGETYTISNLEANSENLIKFSYDIDGQREYIVKNFKTSDYPSPTVSIEILGISNNAAYLKPSITLNSHIKEVTSATLIVNDKEYNIEDGKPLLIEGLTKYTSYKPTIKLTCVDNCDGKTFEKEYTSKQASSLSFKTTAQYQPFIMNFEITKLTSSSATIYYKLYDPENAVTKLTLKTITDMDLELKSEGSIEVTDIDVVYGTFEFELEASYADGVINSSKLSTQGLEYEQEPEITPEKKTCSNAAYLMMELMALTAIIYIFKKH